MDYLLKNNANNPEAIVRKTVQEISNVISGFSEYSLILQLSNELDDKINEYIFNLLTNFKDFPICRKINMRFGPNICVTNLFGYRYPTNEYSLFVLSDVS